MTSPSSILVTGATGNIGQALIPLLSAAGAHVVAASHANAAPGGVPARAVDFESARSLEQAFAGIDTVFLLFPLVPHKLELARRAVAAARAAGVKHLVRSSGAGADATAAGSLARLQGEIDDCIAASGIATTLLRPSSFMQNWIAYYAGMIKSGTVYLPLAQGRVPYVDVRDIAATAAAVLLDPARHAGKVYTLTGPQALSVEEGLAEIGRATGRQAVYVPVSEEAAATSMRSMGQDEWTIDILASLNRAAAAGELAQTSGDVEAVTGRAPRSFAGFVHDHADAWR